MALTMAQRIIIYTQAKQGTRLTPAQRRRIRHKVGHQSAMRTGQATRTG
jgi:hypothetical protein